MIKTRLGLILLIGLIGFVDPAFGSPFSQSNSVRVVFVGDSITGQGGGWINTGFVFQIRKALDQVYPDNHHELIPLGGSGSGVGSWINIEKRSRDKELMLDVKGFGVQENLAQAADVLVVMLGMNDVLAPYVGDDDESLSQWKQKYHSLIHSLRARVNPKTTALATISMCTEAPDSPKNQLINRMNKIIGELAEREGFLLLPVSTTLWNIQKRGRSIDPRFHTTNDFVHPNQAGHIGVAIGMLKGLGETKASAFLESEQLEKIWLNLTKQKKTPHPSFIATPWLLAAKVPQPFWEGTVFHPEKAKTPIDEAIAKNKNFTGKIPLESGHTLTWQEYYSGNDYTGWNRPGNANFSAITHAKNFEGGYGAQWIHSPRKAAIKLNLSTDIFAGNIHLTVWLNGKRLYQDAIEKQNPASVLATLQKGWNTLAFKANHRTWQWQVAIEVVSPDGSKMENLKYSISPR